MRVDRRFRSAVAALVALGLTTVASPASAATFTVNSVADTTDGICGALVGGCTLREAIEAAVATAGRDTIAFDPTVFPRHPATVINVTSPLPLIADAAGTVIDGAGAGVRLSGGAGVAEGLVFTSPPGVPLVKVTVANLVAQSFTDMAVHICGGGPPECQGDVSGALVQHVAVNGIGGDGIRIEGLVVTKSRVLDSVAFNIDGCGIQLFGGTAIVGARVQGCSAVGSGGCGGIVLRANGRIVGATIADSVAVRGDGLGISIFAPDVTKAKLANVVASDNANVGIQVRADGTNAGTKVSDAVASGNGATGIDITGTANTAVALEHVVADDNTSAGIGFSGPTTGARIKGATAVANFHGIDLTGTGSGVVGAKISGVLLAANAQGVIVRLGDGVLQQIHASSNTGSGITLFEGAGGNTVTKSRSSANGANGIQIIDSSGNVIQKNVALGNDEDLSDDNPGCDANTWKGNVFRTGSQPCIH